jgi:hypothetical protein
MKAALYCALLAGCVEAYAPDVGPPARGRCVNEDSDPGTTVSFHDDILQGIFLRTHDVGVGCGCHQPSSDTPIGIEIGGLELSSYEYLRKGGVNSGASIVVPGDACSSVIVQKVGDGPPFGSRMPFSGPPFLSEEDQQVIRDWIVEGALDD